MNPLPNLKLQAPQIENGPPLGGWPDAGVYQLWIQLNRISRIRVGRLGRFLFPAGVYVYTGRASRALRARVLRHVKGGNKKHWHIDYLLVHPAVRVQKILLASRDPNTECAVNQLIAQHGQHIVPGFGASDCQSRCSSHLCWLAA